MRSLKRFIFLILLIILFFPSITKAHDFNQIDSLFFNTNDRLYRQKTIQRPWQLILLPEQSRILQSIGFNEQIWMVIELNSRQYLYSQNRLLNFEAIENIGSADEIVLKATENHLVIFQLNGTEKKLTILQAEGKFEHIISPLIGSKSELERITEINGNLLYLRQVDSQVAIYKYLNLFWQQTSALNCDQSILIKAPIVGLSCLDGNVIRLSGANQATRLNLAPLNVLYSSDEILAGWDRVDQNLFHIWYLDKETNITLPTLSISDVEQTIADGRRILFKKKLGNWHELRWQLNEPKLVELPDTSTGLVIPIAESSGIMINGTKPLISFADESWQVVTVTGSFNTAYQTKLGLLIWNNGSLTQFAPNGSTTFTKVNPWSSTTSPIQVVKISSEVSYVSVVTQSGNGNTNLYKTTDFLHWSRITLPTKPTLSPTIGQTRSLTAGTLVEIAGVITVKPKIVGADILYLEDDTAGIQVYLNQTNGSLPTQTKVRAVVSGEISSSLTKRVLLESVGDLEVDSLTNWNRPIIEIDHVDSYLGRSAELKGSIDSVETDYIELHKLNGLFKLHFINAKSTFQKDDQVIIPAVIDWNSASGKNEAWALSADYQLLHRSTPTSPPVTTPNVVINLATTSQKSNLAKQTSTPVAPTTSTMAPSVVTNPIINPPVLIAGTQSEKSFNDKQSVSIGLVSLITGLISFRGRRFRRLLVD